MPALCDLQAGEAAQVAAHGAEGGDAQAHTVAALASVAIRTLAVAVSDAVLAVALAITIGMAAAAPIILVQQAGAHVAPEEVKR